MSRINFDQMITASDRHAMARRDLAGRIDAERDRRLAQFRFDGVLFDGDSAARARIAQAFTLAALAVDRGAEEDDCHWHGEKTPFVWIAADNQPVQMCAPTVKRLGTAAMAHERQLMLAARALKDRLDPDTETDIGDGALWAEAGA